MNSNSTTKSPRLGPGLRLSKLCRLLFLAVVVKLAIVASLVFDMPFSSGPAPENFSTAQQVAAPAQESTGQTALAQSNPPEAPHNASAPAPLEVSAPRPLLGAGEAHAASAESMPAAAAGSPVTSESLLRRQAELNQREQDLLALERQIDAKLTELQAVEKRIQTMMTEADATRDEKLMHLVDVYTNMKARAAAEALETLDERIAVKILASMRGRQAGEILNFVRPEKAARLSEALTRVQMPLDY